MSVITKISDPIDFHPKCHSYDRASTDMEQRFPLDDIGISAKSKITSLLQVRRETETVNHVSHQSQSIGEPSMSLSIAQNDEYKHLRNNQSCQKFPNMEDGAFQATTDIISEKDGQRSIQTASVTSFQHSSHSRTKKAERKYPRNLQPIVNKDLICSSRTACKAIQCEPMHTKISDFPPVIPPILLTTHDDREESVFDTSEYTATPFSPVSNVYNYALMCVSDKESFHPLSSPPRDEAVTSFVRPYADTFEKLQRNFESSGSSERILHSSPCRAVGKDPSSGTQLSLKSGGQPRARMGVMIAKQDNSPPMFAYLAREDLTRDNQTGFLSAGTENMRGLKHHKSESDLRGLSQSLEETSPPSNLALAVSLTEFSLFSPNIQGYRSRKISPTKTVHGQQDLSKGSKQKKRENNLFFRQGHGNNASYFVRQQRSADDITCRKAIDLSRGEFIDSSIFHLSERGKKVLTVEKKSDKMIILSGTTAKLLSTLTDESLLDLEYTDTFIMTHPFFIPSSDLLEKLIDRFRLDQLSSEEAHLLQWKNHIRLKILNTLSQWIKLRYQDFGQDVTLLCQVESFLERDVRKTEFAAEYVTLRHFLSFQMHRYHQGRCADPSNHSTYSSSTLPSLPASPTSTMAFNGHRRPSGASSLFSLISSISTPPDSPVSWQPSHSLNGNFLATHDAKDVAKYLTLADYHCFKSITAKEYLEGSWRTEGHETENSPIAQMTDRANLLSHWVIHEVCTVKVPKQRRLVIRKLIEIAKHCFEWSNFHTSMVLTMGLGSATVQKLEEWKSLPSRDMQAFAGLEKQLNVSNNMATYRHTLRKAKSPTIPFFPLVIKDLTFLIEGNPTYLPDDMVNFAKCRSLAMFVKQLLHYTKENYGFASDLEYFAFFNERAPVFAAAPLDPVAETVEQKIQALKGCYRDPYCDLMGKANLSSS
ncbi:ras guanine nucleotide exchange factor domain-containing protein [Radiomyces spectabilis]|uniref:ras guanine nucleotide exchange factor domain-containing protein n=1 Tax=Radiomyces spectabilis TaxID=64574 RepID=UPI00221F0B79|nr:ras guanine nucleotide exchange factor domain-containing protein [Radiomyces spectabilis]KAI8384395.1 ras guanine nucleotide exchange factor domain-containing protein [Radiomyces spectabilis]